MTYFVVLQSQYNISQYEDFLQQVKQLKNTHNFLMYRCVMMILLSVKKASVWPYHIGLLWPYDCDH